MTLPRTLEEELAFLHAQNAQLRAAMQTVEQRAEAQEQRAAEFCNRLVVVESEREYYRDLYNAMLVRCKKLERGIIAGNASERAPRQLAEMQTSMALLELLFGDAPSHRRTAATRWLFAQTAGAAARTQAVAGNAAADRN